MTYMKTVNKRVLTFMLAIVTAMAFMPVTAFTQPAYAVTPTLIIGGKTFAFPSGQQSTYATTTNGTVSDTEVLDTEPDNWNIKWDGRTLSLKDAEITAASGKAIYSDARCELHLIGENTVIDNDTASAALLWDGPLTITGEVGAYVRINAVGKGISGSTLSILSGTVYSKSTADNGIYTSGNINISGGVVTGLSTATTGGHSGIKTGGGLSVSGGTVVARSAHYNNSNSGCGAETASAPVITGGAVYAEGGNKAFSAVPVGGTGAALSGETINSSGSKPDKSVVIMTKKDGTTYTPTVTFAKYDSWPAFYSHLWICGFPFSFENGRTTGVTYGAYDSSGSSQWSVTMPAGSSSYDNYLNLNDYTGIGDEEPSGIFDYAPYGYVGSMSINLTGTNKVKTWVNGGSNNAYGIRNDNDLEFSGNGSLAVNVANVESSYVQGIEAYGTLTLNGDPTVTVHATSGKYDVYGISEADPPVINGGSVTASGATAAWFIMNGITANITCNKSGYVPIATYSADMTGTDSSTIINPTDSTTPTVAALFTKNNGSLSLYKYLKLKLGAVKTVTNTLTNIRTNNSSTSWVQDGTSDYTATLSAAKGYALPDSIEVKIGGTTLTAGANTYTYDSTSGALTIRNAVITGNIEIIGTGNELPPLQVTNTLTNMTTNNSSASWLQDGTSDYTATLSAAKGYALPDSIEVKIGGTTLTAGANTYTYDSTSGALTIRNAVITGNIEIMGTGTAVPVPTSIPQTPANQTPAQPAYTEEDDTVATGDMSVPAGILLIFVIVSGTAAALMLIKRRRAY